MRYSLFPLVLLVLLGEKTHAQEESFTMQPATVALLLTGFAYATVSSFQAGRVLYHVYARDRKTIHSLPTNDLFWPLNHESKAFLSGVAIASFTLSDVGHERKPYSPFWYPFTAIVKAVCKSDGQITLPQSIICYLAIVATYEGAWRLMKRSAEWYIQKRGVVPQPKIVPAPKEEITVPLTPENLQTEALFAAALESQAREWYAKLNLKDRATCPICYDSITPATLLITRCEQSKAYAVHCYHAECIGDWKSKNHSDCPTCRGTMLSFRVPPAVIAALSKPQTAWFQRFNWIRKLFS